MAAFFEPQAFALAMGLTETGHAEDVVMVLLVAVILMLLVASFVACCCYESDDGTDDWDLEAEKRRYCLKVGFRNVKTMPLSC